MAKQIPQLPHFLTVRSDMLVPLIDLTLGSDGSGYAELGDLSGILFGIGDVRRYGTVTNGIANAVSAVQQACAALAANGSGTLYFVKGTYLFTLTGDADTILIPSNVKVYCEPGVTFKWSYWGSPLFAIVNKTNVQFELNGALFEWGGTFGTTTGSLNKFGYGLAIAAYEWCAHIISVGSEFVSINDTRCVGTTTANAQNIFIEFRGKADGSQTQGNSVTKILIDDVSQGLVFGEQKRFAWDDIRMGRHSNASNGLYGPGHLMYGLDNAALGTMNEGGQITRIYDEGTTVEAFTGGSLSVQLKSCKHVKLSDFVSRRPSGALTLKDCENVDAEFEWHSPTVDDDTGAGSCLILEPTILPANKYVRVKGRIFEDSQRNAAGINMNGISLGSKNLYCEVDLTYVRTTDGTESVPAINWVGNFGKCTIRHHNKGTTTKLQVNLVNTSLDNNIYLDSVGASPNPSVAFSANSLRNTVWIKGDSTVDSDTQDFVPVGGNNIIFDGHRDYSSFRTIGAGANPTTAIQLPKPGAYLLHINLIDSSLDHSRCGLYWVVFDDRVNDYTTAQVIGTQITKGASAPTVLTLTVSSAGLVTMTSTAGALTWSIRYGYRQLGPD